MQFIHHIVIKRTNQVNCIVGKSIPHNISFLHTVHHTIVQTTEIVWVVVYFAVLNTTQDLALVYYSQICVSCTYNNMISSTCTINSSIKQTRSYKVDTNKCLDLWADGCECVLFNEKDYKPTGSELLKSELIRLTDDCV